MTTAGSSQINLTRYPIRKSNKEPSDTSIETDGDQEQDSSSTKVDQKQQTSPPASKPTQIKSKEKDTQEKPEETTKLEATKNKIQVPIWILVIIFAVLALFYYNLEGDVIGTTSLPFGVANPKITKRNRTEELRIKNEKFLQEMKSIIAMLKNTESNLRYINRSLTIFIKDEQHEKPAIFLLLGTNSSACQLCICTWKFVEALQKYYNETPPKLDSGYIPAEELESRDNRNQQIFIENSIEQVVKSGKHLIIFEDIDRYSNSSLSKIHSYLDHENAPHTNVVYVLTSITADEIDPKIENQKDLQLIATKHFDDRWSQYGEDHRRALMGRMTSVIGLIHKGKLKNELFEHEDVDKTIKKRCQNKCKI